MRESLSLVAIVVLVIAIPLTAVASVEKHTEGFDFVFGDPVGAELCGVDEFTTHLSGIQRITEFRDANGDLSKVHISTTASAEVTGDGELLAWDNYAFETIIDPEAGTRTELGNMFNTHATGEGIVINASGRIVWSLADGTVVEANGPSDPLFAPPSVLICEALNG